MMTTFFGMPVNDIAALQAYYQGAGFATLEEFLLSLKEPEEYTASVSLLKARLARIHSLSEPITV